MNTNQGRLLPARFVTVRVSPDADHSKLAMPSSDTNDSQYATLPVTNYVEVATSPDLVHEQVVTSTDWNQSNLVVSPATQVTMPYNIRPASQSTAAATTTNLRLTLVPVRRAPLRQTTNIQQNVPVISLSSGTKAAVVLARKGRNVGNVLRIVTPNKSSEIPNKMKVTASKENVAQSRPVLRGENFVAPVPPFLILNSEPKIDTIAIDHPAIEMETIEIDSTPIDPATIEINTTPYSESRLEIVPESVPVFDNALFAAAADPAPAPDHHPLESTHSNTWVDEILGAPRASNFAWDDKLCAVQPSDYYSSGSTNPAWDDELCAVPPSDDYLFGSTNPAWDDELCAVRPSDDYLFGSTNPAWEDELYHEVFNHHVSAQVQLSHAQINNSSSILDSHERRSSIEEMMPLIDMSDLSEFIFVDNERENRIKAVEHDHGSTCRLPSPSSDLKSSVCEPDQTCPSDGAEEHADFDFGSFLNDVDILPLMNEDCLLASIEPLISPPASPSTSEQSISSVNDDSSSGISPSYPPASPSTEPSISPVNDDSSSGISPSYPPTSPSTIEPGSFSPFGSLFIMLPGPQIAPSRSLLSPSTMEPHLGFDDNSGKKTKNTAASKSAAKKSAKRMNVAPCRKPQQKNVPSNSKPQQKKGSGRKRNFTDAEKVQHNVKEKGRRDTLVTLFNQMRVILASSLKNTPRSSRNLVLKTTISEIARLRNTNTELQKKTEAARRKNEHLRLYYEIMKKEKNPGPVLEKMGFKKNSSKGANSYYLVRGSALNYSCPGE